MTVDTEQEIARYVGGIRAALADLPPAVRDELLEDLPEHLAEVTAEGTGPLTDRLGPPEAYAAELRAAAGIGAPTIAPNLDQRINAAVLQVRSRLRALDDRLGPIIGYGRSSDFLKLLRPAWWVLRGYLLAMLIANLLGHNNFGMLPRLGNSVLAALLLLAVTVTGSIWLGARGTAMSGGPRWILYLGSTVLVVFGFFAFLTADSRVRFGDNHYSPVYYDNPYSEVQDVFVYDRQGRLLEDVRLFDQNGQPIRLGEPWCLESRTMPDENDYDPDPVLRTYPYCAEAAPFRLVGPEPTPTMMTGPAPSAEPAAGTAPSATPEPAAGPESAEQPEQPESTD